MQRSDATPSMEILKHCVCSPYDKWRYSAVPLLSRVVRIKCQRLLQPTGRFRRRSLSSFGLANRRTRRMHRTLRLRFGFKSDITGAEAVIRIVEG